MITYKEVAKGRTFTETDNGGGYKGKIYYKISLTRTD